jgi:anti-anti-sigma regulatory factor
MTFKLVKRSRGRRTTIQLFGEVKSEHIDLIKAEMTEQTTRIVLDLRDVHSVDVNTVGFLGLCQENGVEVLCSRYVQEWISRERGT